MWEKARSALAARSMKRQSVAFAVSMLVVISEGARAQPAPDPKTTIPEKTVPEGTQPRQPNPPPLPMDTPNAAPSLPKGGVLTPPNADMDKGIHAPAPVPEPGTTPVIPPPGSPGGDPTIKPK